jgi:hypothetical protein
VRERVEVISSQRCSEDWRKLFLAAWSEDLSRPRGCLRGAGEREAEWYERPHHGVRFLTQGFHSGEVGAEWKGQSDERKRGLRRRLFERIAGTGC